MDTGMRAKMGSMVDAKIEKAQKIDGAAGMASLWEWEQIRDGKVIKTWKDTNICTDEGLTSLLDIMFHDATQIATWYIAVFSDDYTPLVTNTYATPGYTESSAYTEANRPAFVEAAAASKSITNSASKATFTINATVSIYGAALVSDNTKGDTVAASAVLYNVSQFSSGVKAVESGDTLKVTITLTASDV